MWVLIYSRIEWTYSRCFFGGTGQHNCEMDSMLVKHDNTPFSKEDDNVKPGNMAQDGDATVEESE